MLRYFFFFFNNSRSQICEPVNTHIIYYYSIIFGSVYYKNKELNYNNKIGKLTLKAC